MSIFRYIMKWFVEKAWPIISKWLEENLIEIIKSIVKIIYDLIKKFREQQEKKMSDFEETLKDKAAHAKTDAEKKVWREAFEMYRQMYEDMKAENEILKEQIANATQQATEDIKKQAKKVKADDIFEFKKDSFIVKSSAPSFELSALPSPNKIQSISRLK